MKKRFFFNHKWYIVVLTLLIFCFSLICWGRFAKSMLSLVRSRIETSEKVIEESSDNTETNTNVENDTTVNNVIESYEAIITSYFNTFDRLANRVDSQWHSTIFKKRTLSNIDFLFTFYVTGEITSSQVLQGINNWLFYKSTTDGNPIGDYEGTNRYSIEEMNNMLQTALFTQEQLESRGIQFAILVAPNKENIYSEYMPNIYIHEDISSTDILINYLAENGVNIVSPKQELLSNHLNHQLYYSYDTHWNQLGAYIGVKDVLSSWGIDIMSLSDRIVTSKNLRDNYHYCGEDDLARMVGLLSTYNDDQEYEIEGTVLMDWDTFENEQRNGDVSHYTNNAAEIQCSVLLVGDSFRSSMVPALREVYSDVYIVHRDYYSCELLDKIEPDYLISEYVERYSSEIHDIDLLIH